MITKPTTPQFAICINNHSYEDDLIVRMVYQVLPDDAAAQSNYLRIVDETGEDYLYPATFFIPIIVPNEADQLLLNVA
ncbi:MAG: hypothetical protein KC423_15285 [Anaerolineales bacterium]|nr:hypothetical protein [Anaerolineales bacterium]